MNKNLRKVSFDWIDADHNHNVDTDNNDYSFQLPIPENIGSAQANTLITPDDISIYQVHHKHHKNISIDEYAVTNVAGELNADSFAIGTAIGGRVTHHEKYPECSVQFGNDKTYFRHASVYETQAVIETVSSLDVVFVTISCPTLDRFIGEPARVNLLKNLNLNNAPAIVSHTVPIRLTKILQQCVDPRLKGSTKLLYSQVKALEYLCELVEYTEQNQSITSQSTQLAAIHDLRDYLNHLEGKQPTLVELSERTNMPAWTLNNLFNQEYGMTIHRYITHIRLEQAHAAIEHSNIPLKALAAKLGYSHVNHFSNAFKREFGYTPGSLRKK